MYIHDVFVCTQACLCMCRPKGGSRSSGAGVSLGYEWMWVLGRTFGSTAALVIAEPSFSLF